MEKEVEEFLHLHIVTLKTNLSETVLFTDLFSAVFQFLDSWSVCLHRRVIMAVAYRSSSYSHQSLPAYYQSLLPREPPMAIHQEQSTTKCNQMYVIL